MSGTCPECCLCPAGVGGNLVAVQASRISTYLHMSGEPGDSPETAPRRCPTPCNTFCGSGTAWGAGLCATELPGAVAAAFWPSPAQGSSGLRVGLGLPCPLQRVRPGDVAQLSGEVWVWDVLSWEGPTGLCSAAPGPARTPQNPCQPAVLGHGIM